MKESFSVIEFETNGTLLTANENFLNLFGYDLNDLQGKHYSMFVPDNLRQSKEHLNFWSDLVDGRFPSGEFKRITKNETELWIHSNFNFIYNDKGTIIKIVETVLDITEEKLAAPSQFPLFVEFDLNGNILTANDNFLNLVEYSFEELRGQSHLKLIPESTSLEEYKLFWERLRCGQSQSGDFLRIGKFAKKIWLRGHYKLVFDISGKPNRILKIAVDLTNSKMSEINTLATDLKLNESENQIKAANFALLNQKKALDCSAIVAETDRHGRITYVNDKFLEISKYSREELLGQDHRILKSGYHSKEFFKDLWTTIKKGLVWHGEFQNRAKDGSYYWVDSTIYPVLDEKNDPQGYVAIRFDITEKKQALLNLESAKEMAVVADKAKSNFLYTMSHEIRTPLNGIIGMTSLLLETNLTAEQNEFAQTISNSGKTLLTIINDILDFSKIEAGKMNLEQVEFDFKTYLYELLKPFHYVVQKKNITLSYECMNYPYKIIGDDGKIGQIITNLVSNAVKFTKEGGITVRADLKSQNDGTTTILLTVHDTGVGIPEQARARMFQAFSQAENTTSRMYGGTGLGLSISKRLIEMMNGKISFESQFGKGTTFKVELLLKTGAEIRADQNQNEVKSENQSGSGSQNESGNPSQQITGWILVAEDNSTNQMVIARMLDKWNCKYHIVANGNEVLDALRDGQFELILMDCQMPEMDGYDATRNIRKSESLNRKIPIVALTANAVQGDQQKCLEAGMDDYLSKPIDRRALQSVLLKYLTKKPQTTKTTSGPMIDRTILNQLEDLQAAGGGDPLVEFINSFLRTSQSRMENLSKYFHDKDIKGAAREAHSLKASAQILGASALGSNCQKLEDLKDKNDLAAFSEIFAVLNEIYQRSCKELTEIKKQRSETHMNN